MHRTIEITNVGAIEHLTIPLPEDGGVVVLRGPNGCGKTTALEASRAIMAGNGKLPVRDACKSGSVKGLGVTIRVGRSTRLVGELEAVHLEDRLRIADLVDPGLKSDDAADGRRIKALVGLTGAVADPMLFPEAARRGLDAIDDLVEQAGLAKRNLETLARAEEKLADELRARARAMREGIDADAIETVDEEALRLAVNNAIRDEASVQERYDQAVRRDVEAARAKAKLEKLRHGQSGHTVATVQATVDEVTGRLSEATQTRERLEDSLREAVAAEEKMKHVVSVCRGKLTAARSYASAVDALQATIDAAAETEPIDEESVKAATLAREAAELAFANGLLAGVSARKLAKAREAAEAANAHTDASAAFREAARSTDEVLADAIQCPVLRIEAGRLITTTKRGRTLFSELSEGERWRIALDIAADRVGTGGIITVPQNAWEGLDIENRSAVADHAKRLQIVILTAEAQREGEGAELVCETVATIKGRHER